MAVDPLGNVLVAGQRTGSFDSDKNVNQGKLDVFVRKLGPSGTVLWTNLFGNADAGLAHERPDPDRESGIVWRAPQDSNL